MSLATVAPTAISLPSKPASSGLFAWPLFALLLIVGAYLPSLNTRFDFIDDGNLVYPAMSMPLTDRLRLGWEKVEANYRDLGPFRPALWVHWEVQAEVFQADSVRWRCCRLTWMAFAAGSFLWLLCLLGIHPLAAAVTTALAIWNPWRGEVWTSLTLAEGIAMPYALLALICAIKGGRSRQPWAWDLGGVICMLAALGCKNTFAAMIPAQVLLRIAPDGMNLWQAWQQRGWRASLLAVTLIFPVAHFIAFKVNRRPGNYDPGIFSWDQLGLMLGGLKGALNLDCIGVGLLLAIVAVCAAGRFKTVRDNHRAACLAGTLLLFCGIAIYLPMQGMAGRYTMPAAWGADLLVAALLSTFTTIPASFYKRLAYAGLGAGLVALLLANLARQDKFAARAAILWEALEYVEQHAPTGAAIAWQCGKNLNIEEGIHFQWHLTARGRGDIRILLLDRHGEVLQRAEMTANVAQQQCLWLLCAPESKADVSQVRREFHKMYHLGWGRFICYLRETSGP